MANLTLNSLKLKAFRSFKDEALFQFPEKGLVLIQGFNKDTGGSSGSGKSTVAEALAYAFDYSSYPATELQSWLTEDPLQVTVKLTKTDPGGSSDISVVRGQSAQITANGKKLAATASSVKSKLGEIAGLDSKMMKALTYRPQRQPGMFLAMGDTEKKSFLSTLLGLGKFEEVADRETKEANRAENVSFNAQEKVKSVKEMAVNEPVRPVLKDLDLLQDSVRSYEEEAKEAKNALDSLVKDVGDSEETKALRAKLDEVAAKIKLINNAAGQMRDTAQQKREILTKNLYENRTVSDRRQNLERDLTKAKIQMEAATRQRCPTCTQEWVSDESQDFVENLQLSIESMRAKLEGVATAESTVMALEAAIRDFDAEMARVMSNYDISALERASAAVKAAIEDSVKRNRATIQEQATALTRNYQNATDALRNASSQLAQAKADNAGLQRHYDLQFSQYTNYRRSLLEAETAAMAAKEQEAYHKDYLALVKGFLNAIFDDVLSEIASETNDILAGVPNVQHVTLSFASATETKTGTIRQSITPVVMVSGRSVALRSGLSGGMAAAVELAVDVALGNVISRRTGIFPGFLILDEALDGLDLVSKEGALAVLGQAAKERLIVVVDHATEIRERFTQSIDIESQGGVSKCLTL